MVNLLVEDGDSPRTNESTEEFVMRTRRTVGLDKYTSLSSHYFIMEEHGIASCQLVFCKG